MASPLQASVQNIFTQAQSTAPAALPRLLKTCEQLVKSNSGEVDALSTILHDAVDRIVGAASTATTPALIDKLITFTAKLVSFEDGLLAQSTLEHLLERIDCKDRFVRLRVCCLVGSILEGLPATASLSAPLWEGLTAALLSRSKDKIGGVRAAAARALCRLQDDEEVQTQLLWLMRCDSVAAVRAAALSSLLPSPDTIEAILERTRDVSGEVRAAVLSKLASQVHVSSLDSEQRSRVVGVGLTDGSDSVKNNAVYLMAAWLWEFDTPFNALKLLDGFGVVEHEAVCEAALAALFAFSEGPQPSAKSRSRVTVAASSASLGAVDENEDPEEAGEQVEEAAQLPTGVSPAQLWKSVREMIASTTPNLEDIDVESMFYLRVRMAWLEGRQVSPAVPVRCILSLEEKEAQKDAFLPPAFGWSDLIANVAHAAGMYVDNDLLSKQLDHMPESPDKLAKAAIACLPSSPALSAVRLLPHADPTAQAMLRQTLLLAPYLDFADDAGRTRAVAALSQMFAHPIFSPSSCNVALDAFAAVLGCGSGPGHALLGHVDAAGMRTYVSVLAEVATRLFCAILISKAPTSNAPAGQGGANTAAAALRTKVEGLRRKLDELYDAEDAALQKEAIKSVLSEIEATENALAALEITPESTPLAVDTDAGTAITASDVAGIYWERLLLVIDVVLSGNGLPLPSRVARAEAFVDAFEAGTVEASVGMKLALGTGGKAFRALEHVILLCFSNEKLEAAALRCIVQYTLCDLDHDQIAAVWTTLLPRLLPMVQASKDALFVENFGDLLFSPAVPTNDVALALLATIQPEELLSEGAHTDVQLAAAKALARGLLGGIFSVSGGHFIAQEVLARFFELYVVTLARSAGMGTVAPGPQSACAQLYGLLGLFFTNFAALSASNQALAAVCAVKAAGKILSLCSRFKACASTALSCVSTTGEVRGGKTATKKSTAKAAEEDAEEGGALTDLAADKATSASGASEGAAGLYTNFWTLVLQLGSLSPLQSGGAEGTWAPEDPDAVYTLLSSCVARKGGMAAYTVCHALLWISAVSTHGASEIVPALTTLLHSIAAPCIKDANANACMHYCVCECEAAVESMGAPLTLQKNVAKLRELNGVTAVATTEDMSGVSTLLSTMTGALPELLAGGETSARGVKSRAVRSRATRK